MERDRLQFTPYKSLEIIMNNICQQIWWSRRNGQIPKHMYLTKMSYKERISEMINDMQWIWISN
jgi:hypothetical protein